MPKDYKSPSTGHFLAKYWGLKTVLGHFMTQNTLFDSIIRRLEAKHHVKKEKRVLIRVTGLVPNRYKLLRDERRRIYAMLVMTSNSVLA